MVYPENYQSRLSLYDTQKAIKIVKDAFQSELSKALNLRRVSAPLFVDPETGLNDTLSGVERPVSFTIKDIPGKQAEVVHSLAKWKRYALKKYAFRMHKGLYTDMNAIRRDEKLDSIHSLYVDQWDWEKVIAKEDRNKEYLEQTVKDIYGAILKTEERLYQRFPLLVPSLPKEISFVTSEALLKKYPELSPKEREYALLKEKKAVFLENIGDRLSDGTIHDKRAPDYDDWHLNGDLLVYYPLLDIAFELSSMGIRVDQESMKRQLILSHREEAMSLPFQKAVIEEKLPLSIGGGIGQSRLCMLLLKKAHIGEIQCSLWPETMKEECKKHNIFLL